MSFSLERVTECLTEYRLHLDEAWEKAALEMVPNVVFVWTFQEDRIDMWYGSRSDVKASPIEDVLPDELKLRMEAPLEENQAWLLLLQDTGSAAILVSRKARIPLDQLN